MNFLKTIQNSIYSPQFYSQVLKKSFKQGISYFLLLILLLTTIRLITLIPTFMFEAPRAIRDFAASIINCYPKELEISITNGKISTNAQEPYIIPPCEGLYNTLDNTKDVLVIDTKNPFSLAKFEEYKTVVWITETSVVYKKNDFETRSYSFSQIKDFKLNEKLLNSLYDQFSPYLKFVGPLLLLLALIGIILSYNFRLVYLLFIALIVWLASKILKKELSYKQSYIAGLYAITLGLLVELIINLTHKWTHFYGFPFMITVITLGVVWINLFWPKRN